VKIRLSRADQTKLLPATGATFRDVGQKVFYLVDLKLASDRYYGALTLAWPGAVNGATD
jgi:hypothetical protein